MKERFAFIPVLSYLRGYFCDSLIDQNYADMADSSFELLAPLPRGFETAIPKTTGTRAEVSKWVVGSARS